MSLNERMRKNAQKLIGYADDPTLIAVVLSPCRR